MAIALLVRGVTCRGMRLTVCGWALLAAARLSETERVAQLREQLLPYRLVCGMGSGAVISGSVAYFTAEAALALGDPEAALADLAIATEMDERIGAHPWLAQACQAITRAQRCPVRLV